MLSIIVAKAENGIIGGDNKLLWHISEDLKRFREITTGHTIIMGRKTFESLPKVLPNRHHVVLTRDVNFSVDSDQVTVVHDLNRVLNKYKSSEDEAFIIGGGEIYNLLFPYAKKLYLTKVNKDFEGDTYFHSIDFNEWAVEESSGEKINDEDGLKYEFVNLIRQ